MSDLEYEYFLIQVHVPEENADELIEELLKQDVIHLSVSHVTNYYKKIQGDIVPFSVVSNKIGEFVHQDEVKLDAKILATKLGFVLHAIARVHPYDKPTVNVIPLI